MSSEFLHILYLKILIDKDDFGTLTSFYFNFKIDLQWMILSCSPTKIRKDSCDELPVSKFYHVPLIS